MISENNYEGIQAYKAGVGLMETIQKAILFKFFDVMISILKPEDIREVTMFMVDKNIQFKDIAGLIKSLFYESSIKEYIDNDCDEEYFRLLKDLVKTKKRAKAKRPICACCKRMLDFDSMITNRCSHAVSVFCVAGIAPCPMAYICPKCGPRTQMRIYVIIDRNPARTDHLCC